jgi:hypothetical protein
MIAYYFSRPSYGLMCYISGGKPLHHDYKVKSNPNHFAKISFTLQNAFVKVKSYFMFLNVFFPQLNYLDYIHIYLPL